VRFATGRAAAEDGERGLHVGAGPDQVLGCRTGRRGVGFGTDRPYGRGIVRRRQWRAFAHERGEDIDDGLVVAGRLAHQVLEGIDATEAFLQLVAGQLGDGRGVPVGQLSSPGQEESVTSAVFRGPA
jgi:hypothetical protein